MSEYPIKELGVEIGGISAEIAEKVPSSWARFEPMSERVRELAVTKFWEENGQQVVADRAEVPESWARFTRHMRAGLATLDSEYPKISDYGIIDRARILFRISRALGGNRRQSIRHAAKYLFRP